MGPVSFSPLVELQTSGDIVSQAVFNESLVKMLLQNMISIVVRNLKFILVFLDLAESLFLRQ